MTERMPEDDVELDALAERCGRLKRAVVDYVIGTFGDEVIADAARDAGFVTDESLSRSVEAFLEAHVRPPESVLDDFVDEVDDLSNDDAALVRRWSNRVTGLFCVVARNGRSVQTRNVVDEHDYRILLSGGDETDHRQLDGKYFLGSVVPLFDGWLISGHVSVLPLSEIEAYGMAAEIVQRVPAAYFRNPEHLESSLAVQREVHDEFVEAIGGEWFVGTPDEVTAAHRELVAARQERALAAMPSGVAAQERHAVADIGDIALPEDLLECDTAGLLSTPEEGLLFVAEFGRFIEAFEVPERARSGAHREIVLEYLESPTVSPAVFRVVCAAHRESASETLRAALGRPGLEWERDLEALLDEWKSSYRVLPGHLCLTDRHAEGLLFAQAARRAGKARTPGRPLSKGETLQRRKKRKRGRRRSRS